MLKEHSTLLLIVCWKYRQWIKYQKASRGFVNLLSFVDNADIEAWSNREVFDKCARVELVLNRRFVFDVDEDICVFECLFKLLKIDVAKIFWKCELFDALLELENLHLL